MSDYTPIQLAEILAAHQQYLLGSVAGKRADLSNANLRNADLSNANLSNANLRNADLSNANLSNADLYGADLSNANLRNANLRNADLSRANLYGADLSNANLSRANLYGASLRSLQIMQVGPIGSRSDYLVYMWGLDHNGKPLDLARAGCWSGTLAEFSTRITEVYPDTTTGHGQAYRAAIALLETMSGKVAGAGRAVQTTAKRCST